MSQDANSLWDDEEEEDDEDDKNPSEEEETHGVTYQDQASLQSIWERTHDNFDDDGPAADDPDALRLEDSDDKTHEYWNWENFGMTGYAGGLSAWDQLGEGYNQEFASIGAASGLLSSPAAFLMCL
ncbi:hypothetical protein DXG03_006431 [Asterophora parasitica]|uniref:Uncharacterized protein n=1 Tax=Asterophora parasitica TaxID=117018 RepID=A0A9P7G1C7_9AGAR|nr:hypothetical protein DXG03_006431 [Asterophora parasitica]